MSHALSVAVVPAVKVASKSILSAMVTIPRNNPRMFAISVATLKMTMADVIAQNIEKKKEGDSSSFLRYSDKARLFVFASYGAIYLGLFQHYLFAEVYTKLFPLSSIFASKSIKDKLLDYAGAISVIKQLAFEAFVHWPCLYIPSFYVFKEATAKTSFASKLLNIKETLSKNWIADISMCWKVWIPSALFNFAFLPLWLQVPFTGVVGFLYFTFFSLRRGNEEKKSE